MRRSAVRTAIAAFALLVATIGLSTASGAATSFTARPVHADGDPIQGSKALSTQLARTDQSLLGLTGTRMTPVIVKFDYDSVASYAGGVAGLRATSPSVTGRALDRADTRVAAYSRYVATRESQIVGSIQRPDPERQDRQLVPDGVRRRGDAGAGQPDLGPAPDPGRRRRAARQPRAAADRHDPALPRGRSGLADARRTGSRGRERARRRDRHRRLARAPLLRRPRHRPASRVVRMRVRRRERPAPRRSVHVQRQARRRVRVHRHLPVAVRRASR